MTDPEDRQRSDSNPADGESRVPPSAWSVERPFDSATYLDRPLPIYEDEDDLGDGTDPLEAA